MSELLRRQGRAAEDVARHAQLHVALPEREIDRRSSPTSPDALAQTHGIRDEHACRPAEERKRPVVEDGGGPDLRVDVLDREGGIRHDVAELVEQRHPDDVHVDGTGRVSPRLELLRRRDRGDPEQRRRREGGSSHLRWLHGSGLYPQISTGAQPDLSRSD